MKCLWNIAYSIISYTKHHILSLSDIPLLLNIPCSSHYFFAYGIGWILTKCLHLPYFVLSITFYALCFMMGTVGCKLSCCLFGLISCSSKFVCYVHVSKSFRQKFCMKKNNYVISTAYLIPEYFALRDLALSVFCFVILIK